MQQPAPNQCFVGQVCHRHAELPSTQDTARALLAHEQVPEGTAVRADHQTAGRGQFGNRWADRPGENLLVTIIFYPTFLRASEQFRLSQLAALALHDTLVEIASPLHLFTPSPTHLITIKWPNDLYLGERKVAGVLIENSLVGEQIQSTLIGIGLNVNQREFPPELPNPTSLAVAFGQNFDLDRVADLLFKNLEIRYLQLKHREQIAANSPILKIADDYRQRLFRLGQTSQFQETASGKIFSGKILGTAPSGHLQVEMADGQTREFDLKEIAFKFSD